MANWQKMEVNIQNDHIVNTGFDLKVSDILTNYIITAIQQLLFKKQGY